MRNVIMIMRALVASVFWLWVIGCVNGVRALEGRSQALSIANIPACGVSNYIVQKSREYV